MKRFVLHFCASILFFLIAVPTVYAQATRTWVSGVGDDANPCSRTAPCKTFAGAISKTASGGEIDALDPGGFGTVTITKPITIDGGGGINASILASGVSGVIINITSGAPGTVILRNLSINGAGATLGTNGVRFLAGSQTQVLIENCIIQNFSQKGIDVALTSGGGSLAVRNTTISTAATGISLASTSSFAFGTVSNSTISFSSVAALTVNGGILNAESNVFSHNPGTVFLPTAGVIRISNNDVFNNGVGTGTGSGTVSSANNNRKAGNGTGFADPTITTF